MAASILVVEDDKEINRLLCKALSNNDYITESAYTGIQGLDMLKTEKYDMVLLDIMLPYKSGDKLLQELRIFSDIPVLVISAKETTQIKILELLLSQPQKVYSKANLFESIWNEEYTVDDNTLNVHISRLRQKLKKANEKEEYIENDAYQRKEETKIGCIYFANNGAYEKVFPYNCT